MAMVFSISPLPMGSAITCRYYWGRATLSSVLLRILARVSVLSLSHQGISMVMGVLISPLLIILLILYRYYSDKAMAPSAWPRILAWAVVLPPLRQVTSMAMAS